MKIGGFQLPRIDLGKLSQLGGGSMLSGIKDSLKKVAGDFFKSGFEAAKKSLLEQVAKALGLPSPAATQGGVSPNLPSTPPAIGGAAPAPSIPTRSGVEAGAIGGAVSQATASGSVWDDALAMAQTGKGLSETQAKSLKGLDPKDAARLKAQYELQNYSEMVQMIGGILKMQNESQKSAISNIR
ncbi:hypothetical protein [Archangium sp.]|jgi:hypothetical protein|uniref:hypothetical protein n=1 Tax=Archangium sp. TaxID=1872627 RepID=UPI002ED9F4ED